jgi:hypothetical protein
MWITLGVFLIIYEKYDGWSHNIRLPKCYACITVFRVTVLSELLIWKGPLEASTPGFAPFGLPNIGALPSPLPNIAPTGFQYVISSRPFLSILAASHSSRGSATRLLNPVPSQACCCWAFTVTYYSTSATTYHGLGRFWDLHPREEAPGITPQSGLSCLQGPSPMSLLLQGLCPPGLSSRSLLFISRSATLTLLGVDDTELSPLPRCSWRQWTLVKRQPLSVWPRRIIPEDGHLVPKFSNHEVKCWTMTHVERSLIMVIDLSSGSRCQKGWPQPP